MSQTETILLVVLGFSLATLIALFIGRLMWTAAIKLGARRMQRQVPSSLVGLQSERDRLRAEYAMLSQRLGSRLEAANLKMAEHMAEVSRHRNRLEGFEKAAAEKDAEVASLRARLADLEQSLAESLAQQTELRQILAAKEENLRKLIRQRLPEAQPPGEEPEDRLRQHIGKLNGLAESIAQDRENEALGDMPLPAPPSDPLVAEKLAEAEQENADLQKELEQLDAEWSRRLEEIKPGVAPETEPPTAVANVISLAARIRDLKKGLGNS